MRITDGYGKLIPPSVDSAKQGAATGKASGNAAPSPDSPLAAGGEKVTVSAEAQRLAALAAGDGDGGKVDRLRAAIQNGTFTIDRQAIAARIVDGG